MSEKNSAAIIVARFLKSNSYTETLDAFLREAELPPDAGTVNNKDDWTIEKILDEKRIYDLNVNFEKLGTANEDYSWKLPAPGIPSIISSLTSSNILHVSICSLSVPPSDPPQKCILATSADRSLYIISPSAPFTSINTVSNLHDSPILCCAVVKNKFILSTSMSGQLVLSDGTGKVISKRKDHQKYAVKVTCLEEEGEWVSIATAGWDGKVNFYRSRFQGWQNGPAATASASGEEQYLPKLDEPLATLTMQSNPEAITLLHHPKTGRTLLLASRRDSTFIYTYALNRPSSDSEPSGGEQSQQNYRFELIHKQNLAPHSNAWIAFTPASFAISPVDPTLLAVATSTVPRMKVIIVRLLLDSKDAQTRLSEATLPPTPASLAHAERAIQEEEEAAIITHASAMAPQTAYSTPHVCWRPDGSGVWVNGDDGAVRGIEARTGKIMKILKEGHNAGSKVRSIFAGWVDVAGGGRNEEVLVSGGFDRRLVVWRVQELS